MKKSKLLQYDLDLYSETLDNGLLVNIVPMDNVNNIYVTFSTKYGSIHDEFIPIDSLDYYKVPMGVAHFLEHKVFEQEDGVDPFTVFLTNGADANANTSNYKTTYLFSGPSNFEKNLEYLLNYVQSPYFTDENVEKEKGIIEQELKMLNDKPYWFIYEKTLENSFLNHPIKYPIGGTVDTIREITKEDLYKCYNSFYHPSNMFITITGAVEPVSALEVIKHNQESKTFKKFKPIDIKTYDEPDNVVKEYEEIKFDVTLPKVSVAYKINKLDYDINRLRKYLGLYFTLLIDTTSELNEELRNKNLISYSIDYESINTDKHILIILDFESKYYKEILDKLKSLVGIKRFTKEDIDRKKKSAKSGYIYASDNVYSINSKINGDIIDYGKINLNDFEFIDSINLEEMNEILDRIDFSNTSTIVLKND